MNCYLWQREDYHGCNAELKKLDTSVNTVRFHICEVINRCKLISSDRGQNSGYLVMVVVVVVALVAAMMAVIKGYPLGGSLPDTGHFLCLDLSDSYVGVNTEENSYSSTGSIIEMGDK